MPSIFKLSYNPQAFRTSLLVTLFAFILDFLFFQLIIPSNVEGINVIVLSILYYLILFLIIRYSIEIYIKLYLERGVKKVLDELNEEILKDNYDEKDLEKLTLNLIQKARERTSEINVLKDQENYRREFLGNISHELKTPLFTIQGYILTLVEGAMKDKKVRDKYLKRAAKGVERLIAIVKDLDLITQFESGIKTVDKTDFNVFDLIDNVFELMEFESEKNTISLKYDKDYPEPIFVNADQERILQVLTNLVVNSLKYGTENGFTKVSVEEYNNDKILVKVSDNGEGIDEQHLPRLFERFYRIDKNRSRKKGGSGLGLSIVKDLDLITQFESGIKTVDKTDFNVFDLIDNVFELMEFESEKNTISLKYDKDYSEPIFVNADQERILQVLTNLVVNSLKYGTENGFTKVSVEEYNNDKIIVKVSDNGEGIDEQHLPRLFERFYRIDKNRSRKKGGSGLGLSIVKHIIEAHQEQIFVKSKIGIGTEFSFTIQKSNT